MQDLPDARLAALALAGSQPAFQEIVRRYERPVYNLICRIVRDPVLAEDIAQETFLKTFHRLATFDSGRRFSSWIFRIANNSALDVLRRKRVDPIAHGAGEDATIPVAGDPVETAALGEALGAALDALRPEWRAALVLRYREGCSYDEIAEALGIPEGTAKTFVHRGRKQMAEAMAAAGWRP